jgi:hypothetical protein
MLDIDKEELKVRYNKGDWEYVFDKLYKIAEFILVRNYKIYNPEIVEDMKQECAENFFKKIEQGKVDGNNNIFSFIWKNSTFRILEILRKENNRNKIAYFLPYDLVDFEVYKDTGVTNKYAKAYD